MSEILLSEGEWKIMKQLWKNSSMSLGELVSELAEETGWTKATVYVMLKRLIAKNAVKLDEDEKIHRYSPLIPQREAEKGETESFLCKVYNGRISLMISALTDNKAISPDELSELKQIIEKASDNIGEKK